jgi:hypothetical protein
MPNLDGIKKFDPEDVKRSRKVVLDTIGEEEENNIAETVVRPKFFKSQKLDAISHNNQGPKEPDVNIDGKRRLLDMIRPAEKKSAVHSSPPVQISKPVAKIDQARPARPNPKLIPVEDNSKKDLEKIEKEGEQKIQEMRRFQLEEERAFHEQLEADRVRRISEERKRKEEEAKRQKEIQRIELQKKYEEDRIRKEKEAEQQKKQALLLREKREKEKEQKKKRKIDEKRLKKERRIGKRKKFFQDLRNKLKESVKLIVYSAISIITLSIIVYFSAAIMLIKLNMENPYTDLVSKYVPIPVIVSRIGNVNYSDYKKIASMKIGQDEKKNIHRLLIQNLILRKLSSNFGYRMEDLNNLNENELSKLNSMILKDASINDVPLSRIKKVDELLRSGQSLTDIKKYADDYVFGSYMTEDQILSKFGISQVDLSIGKQSDIIYDTDGYYIYQVFEKVDEKFGVNYVYIKAKTLKTYLEEEADKLQVWSFI